jgi:hypothetical protein
MAFIHLGRARGAKGASAPAPKLQAKQRSAKARKAVRVRAGKQG